MAADPSTAFADGVRRALADVGAKAADPLHDGVLDPTGAAAALAELADGARESVLLVAHPALGQGSPGYGPEPRDPWLVRVARDGGATTFRAAGVRSGAGEALVATGVRVEREAFGCCELPSCDQRREVVRAFLDVAEGEPRLFAEGRPFAGEPDDGASDAARALARALGVACAGDGPSAPRVGPTPPPPLAAIDAARYAARTEGDQLVLRDLASAGPRGSARRNFMVAAVVAVAAVGVWIPTVALARDGAGARAVAVGAIAALLTLTAYAFFGVARFSSRYVARSSPLAAFGRGRFVVAPWVGRGGAVDLRPEGRLGAAIPANEVTAVRVVARDHRFAVVLESDHGPIDALADAREPLVAALGAAVARAVELAKHPAVEPSPRQRARARAQAPAAR